jgi:peptidoglycan/LPS O-acetylase OafA/YrhL
MRGFVRDRGRQALLLWALCAIVLVWRCVLVYGRHAVPDRTYVASDTRVDSILYGCALAISGNPMLDGASRLADATWKWILLPIALVAIVASFVYRDPTFRETVRYSIQGVALYPVFIAAMRYPTWGPFRLLNLPVMSFLGVLSYPLYLVHHVVLDAFAPPLGVGLAAAGLSFTVSLAIAWAIHALVEKPCARLGRRASGSPAPAALPGVTVVRTDAPAREQ